MLMKLTFGMVREKALQLSGMRMAGFGMTHTLLHREIDREHTPLWLERLKQTEPFFTEEEAYRSDCLSGIFERLPSGSESWRSLSEASHHPRGARGFTANRARLNLLSWNCDNRGRNHVIFFFIGFSIISEALKVIPGTLQTCSNILKTNHLLAISPGGVYEAQFGNAYYKLMWKKRMGFAKVALEAKVPIIPVFTTNIRESFRSVSLARRLWLKIYTLTKLPIVPIYGGFPVKLRTHVGEPIPYDGNLTPEQLQKKVIFADS
ncbi:unnamed protein product [Timema podura]|uniref:Acyltransferase n=1 Tax=Timema podura TaxID=61482 RepID=A0ABN7NNC1_TIMPD|nr:unnamed protein product [Timema podura]